MSYSRTKDHYSFSKNHIKIFHITGSTKFGGDTIYLLSLVKKAKENNWVVDVETYTQEVIVELQKIGVGIISIHEIQRNIHPIKDLISIIKLYRHIKRNKYDIVHTHTSKGGFLGRISARIAGVPVIVHTVQGFAFHEFSSKLSTLFYSSLERFAVKFCDMIISVNEQDRQTALQYGIVSNEKITTIRNGLSDERIKIKGDRVVLKKELMKELNILETEIVVGTTARLSEQKGIEYLLRAIPYVVQENKNVKFVIVGDGPLENTLKLLVRQLGIDNYVVFPGFHSDIAEFLNLFDIFILPSLWEGFSVSLLEAMAVGLPIIATDIKGNREAITKDTGILIPVKDPLALANSIVRVLNDQKLSVKLAENSKARFYSQFTEEMMIKKTWKLYEELMKQKRKNH